MWGEGISCTKGNSFSFPNGWLIKNETTTHKVRLTHAGYCVISLKKKHTSSFSYIFQIFSLLIFCLLTKMEWRWAVFLAHYLFTYFSSFKKKKSPSFEEEKFFFSCQWRERGLFEILTSDSRHIVVVVVCVWWEQTTLAETLSSSSSSFLNRILCPVKKKTGHVAISRTNRFSAPDTTCNKCAACFLLTRWKEKKTKKMRAEKKTQREERERELAM